MIRIKHLALPMIFVIIIVLLSACVRNNDSPPPAETPAPTSAPDSTIEPALSTSPAPAQDSTPEPMPVPATTPEPTPESAVEPESVPESALVTLVVKNIYVTMHGSAVEMLSNVLRSPENEGKTVEGKANETLDISTQGTGVNAVRFVEEDAPGDVIYAELDDWFENAAFSSGAIPEGTDMVMGIHDDIFATEIVGDGVIDIVFVVDGSNFSLSMSIGAKLEAERTPEGIYLLLTN